MNWIPTYRLVGVSAMEYYSALGGVDPVRTIQIRCGDERHECLFSQEDGRELSIELPASWYCLTPIDLLHNVIKTQIHGQLIDTPKN